MRRVLAATGVIAAVLAFATSAVANDLPTTGQRIGLLNPAVTPTSFPANTPFFVRHGFACLPEERAACLDPTTEFRLYVDGQRMTSALDLELNLTCPAGTTPSNECSSRGNLTNFRGGLSAGSHVLRGEWWATGELVVVREATIAFA